MIYGPRFRRVRPFSFIPETSFPCWTAACWLPSSAISACLTTFLLSQVLCSQHGHSAELRMFHAAPVLPPKTGVIENVARSAAARLSALIRLCRFW